MRTNIKDITPRDTYFAVEGTFYPYGYSSIEAYFTNEVTTGCTVPMVSPCGVALNCSRTGRHSKLLCSGAFRNELETHMNACDACMGMFLTGKLTHGNCGQSIRTSRIFDYIRAVLLCPGCNPCTSCGGIARTGEDPHCLNASWHGIVCRNRKCGGCTLDHPPVVTLENYEMNAIPFGSINKLTVTKDGDTWSYFLSEDGTARKVAHIGAGPPAGFVKLSREAMKNVTTRDVYVVPEIFQQGQFFNFVSNLKNLTLESIRCNSCNKACARACYDLQHPIVCTKTEDKADVLYLNDIITLKEYINLCGQDFLDHASATASDGTLYRAGGCPRKDPAHKALCGLHGVNDILVPLSVPSALHRLYIHTYGLARHCQVCKGAMWSNDCLFCQDYAKPEPEIEFEPEEKSETIHDHDRKRSSSFSEQKLAKVARRIKQGNEIQQAFNPVLESDEFTPNQKLLLKTVLEALTKNLQ
ncbi:hypothetical protein [Bradybaena similaris medionivirus]|nr:hypothetical protein [Bradybaena similaris medionivirus]